MVFSYYIIFVRATLDFNLWSQIRAPFWLRFTYKEERIRRLCNAGSQTASESSLIVDSRVVQSLLQFIRLCACLNYDRFVLVPHVWLWLIITHYVSVWLWVCMLPSSKKYLHRICTHKEPPLCGNRVFTVKTSITQKQHQFFFLHSHYHQFDSYYFNLFGLQTKLYDSKNTASITAHITKGLCPTWKKRQKCDC